MERTNTAQKRLSNSRPLAFQIYLGMASAFLVLALVFGSLLYRVDQRQQAFLLATVEQVVDNMVARYEFSLANELFIMNTEALELIVQDMAKMPEITGVGLFQADGAFMAGTEDVQNLSLDAAERQRIRPPYQIIEGNWQQQPAFQYTRPILIIGELRGYIRVYYSIAPIEEHRRLTFLLVLTLLLAIFGGLFFLLQQLLARLVIQPVTRLTDAMRAFESGMMDAPVVIPSNNEIGMMAQAFNSMAQENTRIYGALQDLNKTLEQKVHDRTQALEAEIFERKRIEIELRQAKDAADSANQAKSAFLANMSHELRTPLNAILGFAQVLARSPHIPAQDQKHLATIQRSGDHLLTLINQVLDLSKIESGRISVNPNNINLYHIFAELEDLFRVRAAEKHLDLIFERAPDVPRYVCADDVKLRQVLINLLGNAIKFTQTGGVTVRVQKTCEVSKTSQVCLRFEIEDTGSGIAADELLTVFEPFVQTQTGRNAQEGTGLGLPISRKFAQLMGGDIVMQSEVGRGTVVTLCIRAGIVTANEVAGTQPIRRVIALEPGQPRYKLLIVDDHRDNRAVLMSLLTPFGFELREAVNGQEAIALWEEWQPHLILMDLRMPGMSGYDAAERIRNDETRTENAHTPHCAIIALSASSVDDERTIAITHGCDDFLRKPFREADLFALLHAHLGVRFLYEERKQEAQKEGGHTLHYVLTPVVLAELPPELLAELEQAIITTDITTIEALLTRFPQEHAALADMIRAHVDDFDYLPILKLLQAWREQHS